MSSKVTTTTSINSPRIIRNNKSRRTDAISHMRSRSYLPDNEYKNDAPPDSCEGLTEQNRECYDCELCKKERGEIEETNKLFEFEGYKNEYSKIQLWKCKICNYKVAQENIVCNRITLLRRKSHSKYLCNDLLHDRMLC